MRIRRESRQGAQAERSQCTTPETGSGAASAGGVCLWIWWLIWSVYICVFMCCFVALYISFVGSQFMFVRVDSVWLWNRTVFFEGTFVLWRSWSAVVLCIKDTPSAGLASPDGVNHRCNTLHYVFVASFSRNHNRGTIEILPTAFVTVYFGGGVVKKKKEINAWHFCHCKFCCVHVCFSSRRRKISSAFPVRDEDFRWCVIFSDDNLAELQQKSSRAKSSHFNVFFVF